MGGVREDQRASPLKQMGAANNAAVYYPTAQVVTHGATSVTIPDHQSAVVWPASGRRFDAAGQRWVTFTLPTGGLYVCPQDALAAIGATQTVLPIDYSTAHGWRRWQPRGPVTQPLLVYQLSPGNFLASAGAETGDGGSVLSATWSTARGLCADSSNNLYVSTSSGLRLMTWTTGIVTRLSSVVQPADVSFTSSQIAVDPTYRLCLAAWH